MYLCSRTTKVRTVNLKSENTQGFGGFKVYFMLYLQSYKLLKTNLTFIDNKFNIYLKFFTLTFFHSCILKPLKQFLSIKTSFIGNYKIYDSVSFHNIDLLKSKTYLLFKIPVFKLNMILTENDIKELIK